MFIKPWLGYLFPDAGVRDQVYIGRMQREIYSIIDEAGRLNLTQEEIEELFGIDRWKPSKKCGTLNVKGFLFAAFVVVFAAFIFPRSKLGRDILHFFEDEFCLVDQTLTSLEISRPLINCTMCKNLSSVPKVDSISREEFRHKYAYSGVPLLVTNATANWTAFQMFNFRFLQKLYNKTKSKDSNELNEGCQFFPYLTDFKDLKDFFEMTDRRAALMEDQWYVGWSNCNFKVMKILRKHYRRPEFLPKDSESSDLDWIFVGGYGKGAQMHIDFVGRPSWQAQISGKKTWTLVPPPECENVCRTLAVTVNKGDIQIFANEHGCSWTWELTCWGIGKIDYTPITRKVLVGDLYLDATGLQEKFPSLEKTPDRKLLTSHIYSFYNNLLLKKIFIRGLLPIEDAFSGKK